jgi:hypothetical protein
MLVNTAGVSSSSFNNFNIMNYLFNKNNTGEGMDFGATYKITNKLTISASVTDLGFITWNTGVANYQLSNPGASFTYQGINLNEILTNGSSGVGNALQSVGDSLTKTFKLDTTHKSYTTMLATQMYLSANYNLTKSTNIGLLFYGQVINNTILPATTFSFNQQVGKKITACISYSVYNRSTNNVGFGLALNAGALQYYVVSDNALGLFYPENAQNLMIHFGFNLTFGHKKHAKKVPVVPVN